MRKQPNTHAIDLIAETSAELANLAGNLGLDFLVYILRMAEIEARQSVAPPPQAKQAARRADMH
ncbi:MAG TPA: hypothetical protein VFW22_01265 [Pseudolabrys sp.]|nr:hypothetical protein [Pseudolabrys sp.]